MYVWTWCRAHESRWPKWTASEQCTAHGLTVDTIEIFRTLRSTAVQTGACVKLLVLPTCTLPTMAAEAPLMAAKSAVRDAAEDMPAAVTAAFSK
jgi:hypothetical protein